MKNITFASLKVYIFFISEMEDLGGERLGLEIRNSRFSYHFLLWHRNV
jgi:hypothetical protein